MIDPDLKSEMSGAHDPRIPLMIIRPIIRPVTRPVIRPIGEGLGGGGFNPVSLFANGEQGAFYDPSNFASMFQDAAGTVPVTAVGQPVGRINDLSGNASYSAQATAGKRYALANYSSTLGFAGVAGVRVKLDFVDDEMIWYGPTGSYWIAWKGIAGMQYYPVTLTNGGKLPPAEFCGMVIIDRPLTLPEQANLSAYFGTKATGLPATQAAWECLGASYEGRGGNAGIGTPTWAFGDGTTYSTMFSSTETTSPRESLTFSTSVPAALTAFYCDNNQLTGSIPSLSANTALTDFYCDNNQLTGSIPSLSANTALTDFFCQINQLTGSIPSLSANTALTAFICDNNQLTGSIPSLSANTALTDFYCDNNQLTGWGGGTVASTLGTFNASNNLLPTAAINAILAAFVAAGRTSASGTCDLQLGGSGNATPTGAGITDKATLISRGWTVSTN